MVLGYLPVHKLATIYQCHTASSQNAEQKNKLYFSNHHIIIAVYTDCSSDYISGHFAVMAYNNPIRLWRMSETKLVVTATTNKTNSMALSLQANYTD
jgi:hypothetical protein